MFYYRLLLTRKELWETNSQETLRGLEVLSLPGQEKRQPEVPLPWENLPPYFRRAAANAGIAAAKSHLSRRKTSYINSAEKIHSAVVYYNRMYRDFSSEEITLKVWNGEEWKWMHCRLFGSAFPRNGKLMSPSVVLDGEFVMLHVPVKEPTPDVTPVKQRMKEERNICGLQFTNGDAFAVGCVMDGDGKELGVRYFRGGEEYSHRCRTLLEKINASQKAKGHIPKGEPDRKYWMHLKNLSEHYAHQVSKEIIDFCQEHEASVIAVPRYREEYTSHVMIGSGNWGPLHLSTRIRQYLQYKAWKAGIIVIEVHANGISSVCAICGSPAEKSGPKSKEYKCIQGHRGNRYLNAARNLTRKTREQFRKHVV